LFFSKLLSAACASCSFFKDDPSKHAIRCEAKQTNKHIREYHKNMTLHTKQSFNSKFQNKKKRSEQKDDCSAKDERIALDNKRKVEEEGVEISPRRLWTDYYDTLHLSFFAVFLFFFFWLKRRP
jgi:hypothetical protein